MFAFLVSSEIRAYNRISVFLAFFAVFVLAYHFDWLQIKTRAIFYCVIAGAFVIALYDQGQSAVALYSRYGADTKRYNEERGIVSEIESIPGVTQFFNSQTSAFHQARSPETGSDMTTAGHTSGRPAFDGVGPASPIDMIRGLTLSESRTASISSATLWRQASMGCGLTGTDIMTPTNY